MHYEVQPKFKEKSKNKINQKPGTRKKTVVASGPRNESTCQCLFFKKSKKISKDRQNVPKK
jgi:hypothetical protein